MLRHVAPPGKRRREPRPRIERGPVDDGDEEGVDDDGGVEGRVQGLQGAGEAGEQGGSGARVGEGVEGGDEEVEG